MEVDTKTGIIYCWRNTQNEKRYIGQTINPKKRYKEHKRHLGNYDGPNHFYRAMNKYSLVDDWEYTVIEEVSKEMLDEREIYWIAFYNSNNPEHGYNTTPGGDRHDGYELSSETRKRMSASHKGKTPSEESRRKMSESLKGRIFSEETRRKMSEALKGKPAWNKGKKRSAETRRKMSESLKGRPAWNKGKNFSEETRRKISNSHNPNKIGIYHNDTLITVCDTIVEATHIAGVSRHAIFRIIAGRHRQTRSGYSFKYVTNTIN